MDVSFDFFKAEIEECFGVGFKVLQYDDFFLCLPENIPNKLKTFILLIDTLAAGMLFLELRQRNPLKPVQHKLSLHLLSGSLLYCIPSYSSLKFQDYL